MRVKLFVFLFCTFFIIQFTLAEDSISPISENEQDSSLTSLIARNSYQLTMENNQLIGADLLLSTTSNSEIVLFGENHGIQEIATLAQLLYERLSKDTPRILVTEIGPATAKEIEQMIRNNTFEDFMSKGTNLHSVPFFFLKQEVPLLKKMISLFPDEEFPSIWGLDQEFIAGAPVVIQRLEKLATTEQERRAVKKFKKKAFFNPFLIGMGSGNAVQQLKEVFDNTTSEEAKSITEQLVLSHKIYKEQMGGDYRWSNEERETLMMDNFLSHIKKLKSGVPPMFFKFGSYHLHKGKSPTVKEALGLRVERWGKQLGYKTTSVMVDAISGETLDPLMGGKQELPGAKAWSKSIFSQYVEDQPVLFDLRAIKGHSDLTSISERTRRMVAGYDFLILFPEATAQEFLEGTLVTHAYGIAILGIILVILCCVVFLVVKWLKRRRKRKTKPTR